MRKGIILAFLAGASALSANASGTITLMDSEFKVDTLFHAPVGPGTTQTSLLLTGPSYHLHVSYLTADMTTDKLSVKTVSGDDMVAGGERPSSMAARKSSSGDRYFAGVNGDFYATAGVSSNGTSIVGTSTAAFVSNGEIFRTSGANQQFIIDTNGKPVVGRAYFTSGTVSCGDKNTMFKTVNNTSALNAVSIYTDRYYGNTNQKSRANKCAEVTAKLVEGETFMAGGTFKMEVTGVSNATGDSEIPEGGYVLHGYGTDTSGGGNVGAKAFVEGLSIGDVVTFNSVIKVDGKVVTPYQMISGNPRTMGGGEVLDTESERGDASSYNPRSSIGYADNGNTVIMMVVDGRSTVSNGVRTYQLGQIMQYAGGTDAINLDGGGSSTLYTEPLGIRNYPSDGKERAVSNAIFLVTGNEDDQEIASISFMDWAKSFPKYGVYEPVIYGYNKYGALVDTDVDGFSLSCPAELGKVNGETFVGDGAGTYALTANYNGMTASIPVTVSAAEELSLRLDSVVNDTYSEYAVEVSAMLNGEQASLDPAALTWSVEDETIASVDIDKGIIKGLKNGETIVTGTVGDFSDAIKVIVEKPESNVMAIDPDMDIKTWMIAQVGGKNREVTPYENGMKIKYTGVSGRSPYLRLSKANRLWSLPDAIRISFNPGDAPIKSVTLTTMDAHDVGYTNAMENEIVANEMNVIELRTADWCNADDLSNYPMSLNQIQFGMGASKANTEYEILISGIECIYDAAPASVADALADGAHVATIYPNPINKGESAVITGVTDGECVVDIYTLAGELVSSASVDCVAGSATIPTAKLLQGVYFIKTTAEDGSQYVNKLIVR